MTPTRRELLLSTAGAGLAAAAPALAQPTALTASPADAALVRLEDRYTDELLTAYPEQATGYGLDKGARAALKSRLADKSWEAVKADHAACVRRLGELKGVDRAALSPLHRVDHDVLVYADELGREADAFDYGDNTLNSAMGENATPYVVNQMVGAFGSVPDLLDSLHTIDDRADAEAYVARLSAFARQLDQESARIARDGARGVIAPDFILDNIIGQIADYRSKPVAQWGLVGSLTRRTAAKGIAGDWAARAERACTAEVAPAMDRQLAALKAVRARATADAGVWKLPQGEAYYAWLLKVGTTTPMTAAEIHALGLAQVAEYEARMDPLLRAQGLSQGTVGERMAALGREPRFLYPDDDAGRAQLLAYLNGRIAAMRERLPQAFATLPKAEVTVKRVPPDIQAGAPNGYAGPAALDGSRPSIYYINLRDTKNWPRFALPTLTFHEALPGHVWQGAFQAKLHPIRSILGGFNAYVEGWALYAEQLGDELGLYADDPAGRLGYLQSIQFRACRLVVDTGLHAMRWTREQATAFMVEHTGRPRPALQSEVDRYCSTPGQACGYKVGHSAINRLRDHARTALGPRFDLRAFDDALVLSGPVPLTVLDGVVESHIAARRG